MVGQLSVIAMGHNCSTGALGCRPNKLTDVRYYQGDPHVLVFSSHNVKEGSQSFPLPWQLLECMLAPLPKVAPL